MGRKSVVPMFKMFDGADISSDVTSEETSVKNLDKASILIEWTGTAPVGTLIVQANSSKPEQPQYENWVDLPMSGTVSISGNSGSHWLIFNELPFTDIRLFYDRTSGTGTITATFSGKVMGS